ncbi:hypothetical protein HDU67_009061 [Dinochytrium kinnereticum]|nr:hypothetical protein HDU67_009061 [Dinochytrium kinnereticum]
MSRLSVDSTPQQVLRQSAVPSLDRGFKTSAIRCIQGVFVRDAGCQTSESFVSSDLNFIDWWISSIPVEDPDEAITRLTTSNPSSYDPSTLLPRCPGPDADDLIQNGNLKQIYDTDTEPLGVWTIPPPGVKKPKALRPFIFTDINAHGFSRGGYDSSSHYTTSLRSIPGTPLSERSTISTSSEDGCSSVSSFGTLPSLMSSPDSTRVASIGKRDKVSAFSSAPASVNYRGSFRASTKA